MPLPIINGISFHGEEEGALNTKSLRIFCEVARCGSFSAAAKSLGLTQPAVSFQVRALEKEYGNTLIDRSTGRCRLTDAGKSLLSHAHAILEKEEELKREMMERSGVISGPLSIAASNIPGEYILPPVLALFRERHPHAEPRLEITDSGEVLKRVRAGEVDLGATGYRDNDERLAYGELCRDRLVFIAPPRHPLSSRRGIKPAELKSETMIWREEGSGTRSHMARVLEDLGLEGITRGAVELGSTMAVIQAVSAGAGISLISLWAADAYIGNGKLAVLDLEGPGFERLFFYVTLRHRHPQPAISALIELVEEERPSLNRRLAEISVEP
jgi:molybdate transport repressor ModE-like protein